LAEQFGKIVSARQALNDRNVKHAGGLLATVQTPQFAVGNGGKSIPFLREAIADSR